MRTDLEEIKNRLNIVDVLGEYIRLDKAGVNFRALCPFHNEKTPSFMVSEEKQIWHCFGCQKGGDIFGFVMEMEGLEFREALKMLAEKAGVKLQAYSQENSEKKNKTFEILELATKFYEVQLWKGEGKEKIMNYLKERGLKEETIREFRLGYAPKGWRNVLNFLMQKGYKLEEILQTGLLVKKENSVDYYDRFRDRIIFPIGDYFGRILGYSARVAPGGDETQAKYVNTPETSAYHKSRVLYGIDKAKSEIKKQDSVLLVEGNMDVIATNQAGIKNVVAVSGTAFAQEQVEMIKRYTKNINMFFDMDSAGENATRKSVKSCLSYGMNVKIVNLPEGKDAADIAKNDPQKLKDAIAAPVPFMEYFFSKTISKFDKNKIEDKKKITEELIDMIINLENEIEKNYWIKKLGEELKISETALTDELKKASLKNKNLNTKESEDSFKKNISLTKKEMLTQELIGLMLVSENVWKEAVLKFKEKNLSLKDDLLGLMLEKGEKSSFDFTAFMGEIAEIREISAKAEKIFFQKKYRLGINNNLEEVAINDPLKDFIMCIHEIEIENKREELNKISSDLKAAQERGDKEVVSFLLQESNRISKELGELIK